MLTELDSFQLSENYCLPIMSHSNRRTSDRPSRSPVARNRSVEVPWNPNSSNYQPLRHRAVSADTGSAALLQSGPSHRNRNAVPAAMFTVLESVNEVVRDGGAVNTSGETINSSSAASTPIRMANVPWLPNRQGREQVRSEGPMQQHAAPPRDLP